MPLLKSAMVILKYTNRAKIRKLIVDVPNTSTVPRVDYHRTKLLFVIDPKIIYCSANEISSD